MERTIPGVFWLCVSGLRPEKLPELIDHAISAAEIEPGMRIMDAGCGVSGGSVRIAEKINVSIDAITISNVQALLGQERVRKSGFEGNISVRQGNFAELTTWFSSHSVPRLPMQTIKASVLFL